MKFFRLFLAAVTVATIAVVAHDARAQALGQAPTRFTTRPTTMTTAADGPTLYEPQLDVRTGGVLDDSYSYHRLAQPAAPAEGQVSPRPGPYPPPQGWYGYGFPVTTYRWGWFGAERYYPRVGCRSDYNGDRMRWAYRYGY